MSKPIGTKSAIWYFWNSGDTFSLQRPLGHSSLEMVRHYLNLVEAGIENAHCRASPADNFRL